MKFDETYNKLMTENRSGAEGYETKLDKISRLHKLGQKMSDADAAYVVIHDALNGSEFAKKEDYMALAKELKDGDMSNDEHSLETLQKALEYAKYDGWSFDVSHIMELLGGNEDLERDSYENDHQDDREEEESEYGMDWRDDDLQQHNQDEVDDYRNEGMKFEKICKRILNEVQVDPEKFDNPVINNEDVREMIASVGWAADDGLLLEPFDFSMWDEDEAYYKSWLESQPPEFVDFKKGAMEVMNYAKQYGATTQDLAELKKHLIELGKDYKEQQFFLYGIEADLSLGVI